MIASLHYLYSFDNRLGGGIHAPLNICRYLTEANQPTEIIAPFDLGDDLSHLETVYAQVTTHRFPKSGPRKAWYSSQMTPWLKTNLHRFQIAEIHCIWSFSALRMAQYCVRANVPYLVRPHGSLDLFDVQKKRLLKRLLGPTLIRGMLASSLGIVCTASMEAERMVTYGSHPKSYVLPIPVVLPDQKGDRARFRQKHQIPEDAPVVLFLSRIDYKKGLNFLIPAIAELQPEFPKLRLVLAGTGTEEYTTKVRNWINDAGIQSQVTEIGFVSGLEKQDALAGADLFCLPSLNENFGMVNVEAMHAGLPLIISDQVYIHREIEAADAGFICKPSVESVVEVMRQALLSPAKLRWMGTNAAELVQQRYRPEAATNLLIDLYRQVLGTSQPSK